MNLCRFRDVFGAPGTGVHSHRVPGLSLATVDLGLTIAVSYLISQRYSLNPYKTLGYAILLGIVVHKLFCVDTQLNKWIFE